MADQQRKRSNDNECRDKVKDAVHICSKYEAGLIFVHILCNNRKENEIKDTL